MDIVSPHAQQGKLHYVYTLAYPESMGGSVFYVGKGANGRINNNPEEEDDGHGDHDRDNVEPPGREFGLRLWFAFPGQLRQ